MKKLFYALLRLLGYERDAETIVRPLSRIVSDLEDLAARKFRAADRNRERARFLEDYADLYESEGGDARALAARIRQNFSL